MLSWEVKGWKIMVSCEFCQFFLSIVRLCLIKWLILVVSWKLKNISFRPTAAEKTDTIIKYFPAKNAAGSDILVNLLQQFYFCFDQLTNCVRHILTNGSTLKNVNATSLHKKDDSKNSVFYPCYQKYLNG